MACPATKSGHNLDNSRYDDPFAAFPAGIVHPLLQDVPTLTDTLLYHVVAGKVLAADVVNLSSATTLQGSSVAIDAPRTA